MATRVWNSFQRGDITQGTDYVDGTAPVSGDTVSIGNGSPTSSGQTIDGVTFDLFTVNNVSFTLNSAGLGPATVVNDTGFDTTYVQINGLIPAGVNVDAFSSWSAKADHPCLPCCGSKAMDPRPSPRMTGVNHCYRGLV